MKITFELPIDSKVHQYCTNCLQESVERVFVDGKTYYKCNNCQQTLPRSLVIDPQVTWWVDQETKEYWHESVGIIISNRNKKILLFDRKIFPFALTIPAGHLDADEEPLLAAVREVSEEVGATPLDVALFSQEDVIGDECRRGADAHRWSLFTGTLSDTTPLTLNDEAADAVWLTIDEALNKELTYPLRYFLQKYGSQLIK